MERERRARGVPQTEAESQLRGARHSVPGRFCPEGKRPARSLGARHERTTSRLPTSHSLSVGPLEDVTHALYLKLQTSYS